MQHFAHLLAINIVAHVKITTIVFLVSTGSPYITTCAISVLINKGTSSAEGNTTWFAAFYADVLTISQFSIRCDHDILGRNEPSLAIHVVTRDAVHDLGGANGNQPCNKNASWENLHRCS